MEEEGNANCIKLPDEWKERGKYICRYLAILFCHQFIFEMDIFCELTEFPKFLEFMFKLTEQQKDTFVSSTQ
jgi:hypothetical protein